MDESYRIHQFIVYFDIRPLKRVFLVNVFVVGSPY